MRKHQILFVDNICPDPYDNVTLATKPMGGTEATVVRIAEKLGSLGVSVTVSQHNREGSYTSPNGVQYVSYALTNPETATHVVNLRDPDIMASLKAQAPSAKHYLWAHDIITKDFLDMVGGPIEAKATLICVSQWHKTQAQEALRAIGAAGQLPVRYIYNPVDDELRPDDTKVNFNKFVFFSSPHKGLKETLDIFKILREYHLPEAELYIANPGYLDNMDTSEVQGVTNLGKLSHGEVIRHVREAVGVMHINYVFPETFGLVHAEAHAVGTPFLTHAHGAVREIFDHPSEVINCKDNKRVIDTLVAWAKGQRPKVRLQGHLRLASVIREWINLFNNNVY